MIILPVFDLLALVAAIFVALTNRGTIVGFVFTGIVIWQVLILVKFFSKHP